MMLTFILRKLLSHHGEVSVMWTVVYIVNSIKILQQLILLVNFHCIAFICIDYSRSTHHRSPEMMNLYIVYPTTKVFNVNKSAILNSSRIDSPAF